MWTEENLRNLDGLKVEDIRIARRDGAIAGVMALWDQSAYKQSVVRGYSGWMRFARPFLPRVGENIRSAYAALICVAPAARRLFRRPLAGASVVFADLLSEISNLAAARGFTYLLLGLDARDPLLSIARSHRHYAYPSRLYLASWSNGGLHEQLDQRPAYVDIATL